MLDEQSRVRPLSCKSRHRILGGSSDVTPFRSHHKGTLILKGRFAGVKLERASGTQDPRRLADLKAMCRSLAEAGRLDVLENVSRVQMHHLEVLCTYRSLNWLRLPIT